MRFIENIVPNMSLFGLVTWSLVASLARKAITAAYLYSFLIYALSKAEIMNNEDLEILQNKTILNIETEIATVVPFSVSTEDEITIKTPLKIGFDEYILFVYNRWNFVSQDFTDVKDLQGGKIISADYRSDTLELKFSGDNIVKIDLSDDGYIGPESLVLYGPEGKLVVWN